MAPCCDFVCCCLTRTLLKTSMSIESEWVSDSSEGADASDVVNAVGEWTSCWSATESLVSATSKEEFASDILMCFMSRFDTMLQYHTRNLLNFASRTQFEGSSQSGQVSRSAYGPVNVRQFWIHMWFSMGSTQRGKQSFFWHGRTRVYEWQGSIFWWHNGFCHKYLVSCVPMWET